MAEKAAGIQRRTADAVFELLRDQIIAGRRAPGARLDPAEVAGELGVSRTPVREAILRLDAEGLVERLPYRGVVVAEIDVRGAEELAALRVNLETLAARLAVPRLRQADLDAMRAAHSALGEVLAGDPTADRFNELNRAFHWALYRQAESPLLLRTVDSLGRQADRVRIHFDLHASNAQDHHAQILQACERGDADGVVAATRDHILAAHLMMMPQGYQVRPGSALEAVLRTVS